MTTLQTLIALLVRKQVVPGVPWQRHEGDGLSEHTPPAIQGMHWLAFYVEAEGPGDFPVAFCWV